MCINVILIPKYWYSKTHFERRCTEIYASEQAILRCMESLTRDPKDVIFDYIMELEQMNSKCTKLNIKKHFNIMIFTLNTLYDYFY